MEDGKLRPCCNRHFCKSCYEGTGNCPGCHLITLAANKGVINNYKSRKEKTSVKEPDVRDGEECRLCLRQGFRRRCCGEFFCRDCYFKTARCPSCQHLAEKRVSHGKTPADPGLVPVLIGYLATLLVSLAVLACVAVAIANDKSLPTTVFGQTCYGFFPKCSAEAACVAFEGAIEDGPHPITEWRSCDDETTVDKMYGSYCIFDRQVTFVFLHPSIHTLLGGATVSEHRNSRDDCLMFLC